LSTASNHIASRRTAGVAARAKAALGRKIRMYLSTGYSQCRRTAANGAAKIG
jgi:hypothetical protein